jgi:Leucine-rich repeat (LRR) protein
VGDDYQRPDFSTIPETTRRLQVRKFSLPTLEAGDWEHLTSLTDVSIEECSDLRSLSNNDTWAASADKLEHLDVTRNGELASVEPGAFFGLNVLRALDLSGNSISALASRTFDGLPALEHLSLKKNGLATIANDALAGLKSLRYEYST